MKRSIVYSARSHAGKKRENNEDNLFANGVIRPLESGSRPFSLDGVAALPSIFAVCDGMGGEEAGEMASFLAMRALLDGQERLRTADRQQLCREVQAYAERAHRAIREGTRSRRSGAALALAAVSSKGVCCFNLGDSRIYSEQKGRFCQVTHDHTVAAERSRSGAFLSERDRSDFRLTRCIGIGEMRTVEAYPAIEGDCRFLICSDGLTDMVSPMEIEHILRTAPQVSDAADGLLRRALECGGLDNITVIAAEVKRRRRLHGF